MFHAQVDENPVQHREADRQRGAAIGTNLDLKPIHGYRRKALEAQDNPCYAAENGRWTEANQSGVGGTLPVEPESSRDAREMAPERLIGAWNLVAWFEIRSGGNASIPSDETGKLIYTADGHVSAQIVQKSPARFRNDDWRKASQAEVAAAWKGYFGYFGTYSVNRERQLVIHHIEGAFFPNLTGTDQVRSYSFEGERLILDADTDWGRIRAVWERAPASDSSLTAIS